MEFQEVMPFIDGNNEIPENYLQIFLDIFIIFE